MFVHLLAPRPLIALTIGLSLMAGCQALPVNTPSELTAAANIDPATRTLLDALNGMAFAGSTFEVNDGLSPVTQPAGYAIAAAVAPVQMTTTNGGTLVTGPAPAPLGVPSNYAPRAVGGWLTANPLVKTAGNLTTTETYYTPGGTTQATAALTSKTVVGGVTTNDAYTAPWVAVSDVPTWFKSKLTLPGTYSVQQAEETFKVYTNGAVKGSAVGYRWNVIVNGQTYAWIRSHQVTQADGTKVDHWEITSDYQTVNGKYQATKTVYGNYWETTRTANEGTRALNVATGVVTGTGTWQDLNQSASVTMNDTIQASGAVSRVLTRRLADGRTMVVNETYAADNSGTGTVLVDNAQVGTLTWNNKFRGTVTMSAVTAAYIASRMSTTERPQVLDLVPPSVSPSPAATPAPLTGTVSTVAGSGSSGFVNGTGTAASFYGPNDVVRDSKGNLFVTDVSNNVIRKITPAGVVSTFCTGFYNVRGLAIDEFDNLYTVETYYNVIYKITSAGVKTQLAGTYTSTSAFADGAGTTARFSSPYGLCYDGAGSLYIADTGNHRIRKLVIATATVSTVAGSGYTGLVDGRYDDARFTNPRGVAYKDGIIYVADTSNQAIRKISTIDGVVAVTTIAGTNATGYVDANGPDARFYNPWDISVDKGGNLYVVDQSNHRIRKVDLNRNVTTVTGGAAAYADGTLSQGRFSSPNGIAIYNDGSAYVTEIGTHRIRKIALNSGFDTAPAPTPAPTALPANYVTTIAGTGSSGFVNNIGPTASFYSPNDVVRDSKGNLFVTDASNNVIRRISPYGIVTTFASGFYNVRGLAIDENDNLYAVETYYNVIYKITPAGVKSQLAGTYTTTSAFADGAGTTARFSSPYGICYDGAGALYIADTGNHRIRKLVIATATVSTVAGSGSTGLVDGRYDDARFTNPRGVAFKDGIIYVADTSNQAIRKISTIDGVVAVTTIAGTNTTGYVDANGAAARFYNPWDINIDAGGNLYVTDQSNHRIRKIDLNRNVTTVTGAAAGFQDGHFSNALYSSPNGFALYADGNAYMTEIGTHRVRRMLFPSGFDAAPVPTPAPTALPAGYSTTIAGTGSSGFVNNIGPTASFYSPNDVVRDSQGNLFVTDALNNVIRRISPYGIVTTFASGFYNVRGLAIDENDNLYAVETYYNVIYKITPAGVKTQLAGTYTTTSAFANGTGTTARFSSPYGLCYDGAGALYIADTGNHRIRKLVIATGAVSTLTGSGSTGLVDGTASTARFTNPRGVVFKNGWVYVADTSNQAIRKVSAIDGSVTTLAGTNVTGYADGVGANARFYNPWDIDVDAAGNLYVVDQSNHRIRKIVGSTVSTLAGGGAGYGDGPFGQTLFSSPNGLTFANNGLYVTEIGTHRIRRLQF